MLSRGVLIFAVKVAAALVLLMSNYLLNRVFGLEAFGQFAYVLGYLNILAVIICFGGDTLLKREVSKTDDYKSGGITIRTSDVKVISAVAKQSLCLWCIGLILLYLFFYYVSPGKLDSTAYIFSASGALVLLMSASRIISAILIAKSAPVLDAIMNSLMRPMLVVFVMSIIVILASYKITVDEHVNSVLIVYCVSAFIVVACQLIYLFLKYKKKPIEALDNEVPVSGGLKLLRLCAPLALVSSAVILERNIDLVMLGYFHNTDLSALYFIATKVSSLFLMTLFILNSIVTPSIVRAYESDQLKAVEKTARKVSMYSSLSSACILILTVIFGKWVLGLFGEEYLDAYIPMLLLCGGNLIRTLVGPAQMVGVMCGFDGKVSRANILGLIANVSGNLILIPFIGLYGAVISTVVTRIFRSLYISRYIEINLGIRVGLISILRV